MSDDSVSSLLDGLVAEYGDRRARGADPAGDELLSRAPPEHRDAVARCFAMIDAGLASAPRVAAPLAPGTELGSYRILRVLGRGGMATVYLAQDLELRREVALKVLRPGLAADPRHVERFRREALAIARLRHAHVVQVFAVGEAEGHHFIAMERADGPSLAQALRDLPPHRARTAADLAAAARAPALARPGRTFEQAVAALLAQAADGIAAAHANGILHRDLKPSNVLLRSDGSVVVADFGLAKEGDEPALSLTGEPIGTPFYMSPEQVAQQRQAVDARTDVYSLGVTLYEALAGRRPFEGTTALAVFDAIRRTCPPALRLLAPECTADAQAVVRRAMARLREERYPDARALADDLRRLAAGEPTAARRREGGPVRRFALAVRALSRGPGYEHLSRRCLLGWPLLHVHGGAREPGAPPRRARGWIAVGDVALGAIAIGRVRALGLLACAGGFAAGGLAFGGVLSLGALALAGAAALGLVGLGGGLGAGVVGLGGGLGAGYVAAGGSAAGHYALGGAASGAHVISGERRDAAAVAFFSSRLPWLWERLPAEARRRLERPLQPRAAAWAAPGGGADGWYERTLAGGIRLAVLHVPDAPRWTMFTFLPLGLGSDPAQRAQFSHLAEHMLIRATDAGALGREDLVVNGETTAAELRLEAIAAPERWEEALGRHVAWLRTRELEVADAVLAREKERIAAEEATTVERGYTHKWAVAAWNQVARHGAAHAAVHGDVAGATAQQLQSYVRELADAQARAVVFAVGPVEPQRVHRALAAGLGDVAAGTRRARPPALGEVPARATWDLAARHYLEWYELPDAGPTDRAEALLLAQLLQARLHADARLAKLGAVVYVSADLIAGERRLCMLSASLPQESRVEDVAAACAAALHGADEEAFAAAPALAAQLAARTGGAADLAALRAQMRGRPGAELLEANLALQAAQITLQLDLPCARASAALRAVTPGRLAALRAAHLVPEARASLELVPRPQREK